MIRVFALLALGYCLLEANDSFALDPQGKHDKNYERTFSLREPKQCGRTIQSAARLNAQISRIPREIGHEEQCLRYIQIVRKAAQEDGFPLVGGCHMSQVRPLFAPQDLLRCARLSHRTHAAILKISKKRPEKLNDLDWAQWNVMFSNLTGINSKQKRSYLLQAKKNFEKHYEYHSGENSDQQYKATLKHLGHKLKPKTLLARWQTETETYEFWVRESNKPKQDELEMIQQVGKSLENPLGCYKSEKDVFRFNYQNSAKRRALFRSAAFKRSGLIELKGLFQAIAHRCEKVFGDSKAPPIDASGLIRKARQYLENQLTKKYKAQMSIADEY